MARPPLNRVEIASDHSDQGMWVWLSTLQAEYFFKLSVKKYAYLAEIYEEKVLLVLAGSRKHQLESCSAIGL